MFSKHTLHWNDTGFKVILVRESFESFLTYGTSCRVICTQQSPVVTECNVFDGLYAKIVNSLSIWGGGGLG